MDFRFGKKLNKIWEAWNLRGFVLFSLSLQVFLILFAPFRKRMVHKVLILFIGAAYLLADWAANYAFGLISNSQFQSTEANDNTDLLAFWAPFLLVHLGGPDTITAYALEDNELWRRHLLSLISHTATAGYVFIQTIPYNSLWIMTILIFLTGMIKYAERTRSLYIGSLDSLRNSMLIAPDAGPNYAKLMEEYTSMTAAEIPAHITYAREPNDVESMGATNYGFKEGKLDDLEIVQYAYNFFVTFKGLVVDLIFSFNERNKSREFFHMRDAEDAFTIIEIELSFIYEILYTKAGIIHTRIGYFLRFVTISLTVTTFSLFYCLGNVEIFDPVDVKITYVLLIGAICLDIVALLMLVFSDWTAAALKQSNNQSTIGTIFKKVLFLRRSWTSTQSRTFYNKYVLWVNRFLFRRWSGYVSVINLMDHCLKERLVLTEKVFDSIGLTGFLDEIQFVSRVIFTESLRDFIFEELQTKSKAATTPEIAKKICSARGGWILKHNDGSNINCRNLFKYVDDVDYSESLLLWHIATELCYHDEDNNIGNKDHRDLSKNLSDYMLYLLVMKPTMMAALSGIGQKRFKDTCQEAKNFLFREGAVEKKTRQEVCREILAVNTSVAPKEVKGDRSKSVLFDACNLAKNLKTIDKKWIIMSKVWVELLAYAATHCQASTQIQQLNTGGELIVFVWLLMAHFGFGEQFQIYEGDARAKLIVQK